MSLPLLNNPWEVPPEWKGERCLIICGGESVRDQQAQIKRFDGRVIALKQAVAIRPDADVMFVSGKDDPVVCRKFFPMHTGQYLVARGPYHGLPIRAKILKRTADPCRLSLKATHLAGYDGGTSAINLAFLFGATEIILAGFDMTGGRWLNGRFNHHLPIPPQQHHDIHLTALPTIAADLKAQGVRVINVSPVSAVTVFERGEL